MSLNVDQILRWSAMNTELNEGNFDNMLKEEDILLESEHTKGTLPLCVME